MSSLLSKYINEIEKFKSTVENREIELNNNVRFSFNSTYGWFGEILNITSSEGDKMTIVDDDLTIDGNTSPITLEYSNHHEYETINLKLTRTETYDLKYNCRVFKINDKYQYKSKYSGIIESDNIEELVNKIYEHIKKSEISEDDNLWLTSEDVQSKLENYTIV